MPGSAGREDGGRESQAMTLFWIPGGELCSHSCRSINASAISASDCGSGTVPHSRWDYVRFGFIPHFVSSVLLLFRLYLRCLLSFLRPYYKQPICAISAFLPLTSSICCPAKCTTSTGHMPGMRGVPESSSHKDTDQSSNQSMPSLLGLDPDPRAWIIATVNGSTQSFG